MKYLLLSLLFTGIVLSKASAQTSLFDTYKIQKSEIDNSLEFIEGSYILMKSANTFEFYNLNMKYNSVFGKVVEKDFQGLSYNGVEGCIYLFEFEKDISEYDDAFNRIIRNGSKQNKDHPEEYFLVGNVLIVSHFPHKSELASLVSKLLKQKTSK